MQWTCFVYFGLPGNQTVRSLRSTLPGYFPCSLGPYRDGRGCIRQPYAPYHRSRRSLLSVVGLRGHKRVRANQGKDEKGKGTGWLIRAASPRAPQPSACALRHGPARRCVKTGLPPTVAPRWIAQAEDQHPAENGPRHIMSGHPPRLRRANTPPPRVPPLRPTGNDLREVHGVGIFVWIVRRRRAIATPFLSCTANSKHFSLSEFYR